jgi:lipopolysaccharide export system protein LptA
MLRCNVFRIVSGLVLWISAVPWASALDSDSGQPIIIEANQATFDEATGETVYIGDVQATQGSLVVNSDHMTVYQKDSKTDKVVAIGKPVRLKQTPEGGGDEMNGVAQRAEYFPETGVLILLERAVVTQGTMTTESDRIEYDSAKGVAKAGSPASSSKRVHVTLQPKDK